MATKVGKNSEKYSTDFCCKFCDYICYKKQHYNQHLLTNKHKTNEFNCVENKIVNKIVKNIFDCDCGKKYKDRTGLWKHKRTCNLVKKSDLLNEIAQMDELVKDYHTLPITERWKYYNIAKWEKIFDVKFGNDFE